MARKGKFAKLRDAYKAARAARQAAPTPQRRLLEDYLQRARAASVMYSKLRERHCDKPN